jgi:hypothetical protein
MYSTLWGATCLVAIADAICTVPSLQLLFAMRLCLRELSLSQIKSEHIGGVARRELGDKECFRPVRRRARPARPSPRIDACVPHYNISDKTAAHVGGAALRTQQRGQGIPVGSNRSAVRHIHFATGSVATLVGRECPIDRSRRMKTLP